MWIVNKTIYQYEPVTNIYMLHEYVRYGKRFLKNLNRINKYYIKHFLIRNLYNINEHLRKEKD